MKIVVPIPVYGRLPLLVLTIERLQVINKVHKVICVGHEPEARELCESLGCDWVEHPNNPLGAKWNAGFLACEKYSPDAVLYCGSSDWVSNEYLVNASLKILQGADIVGSLGCTFVDVAKVICAVNWPGYVTGARATEPIGIGRLLSSKLLKQIHYQPFDSVLHNSLDRVMWDKAITANAAIRIIEGSEGLVSISTNRWENKHKFEEHWTNKLPSKKLTNMTKLFETFPEINLLTQ